MSEIVNMPEYSPYQILTPTSTASPDKMYNWPFDVASTSSPMPQQAAVAHEMMMPYHMDERRSPEPPQPYHGMYGVSAPADHRENPYYMSTGLQMPMEQPMNTFIKTEPAAPSPPDVPRSLKTPNKKPKVPRRASKSAARKGRSFEQEDYKNCRGEEVPPTLKPSCPPEEKCILESRWRHRSKKGQDMWDSIMKDYDNSFNKPNTNKETLQMKFKRARTRYYEWLPEDLDILRNAFAELEKNRYDILLEKFLELGGSRNMQLNPGDVEVKVVTDLKLEEGLYMEDHKDMGVRRRKKVNARKGQRGGSFEETTSVSEDQIIDQVQSREWNGHFSADMAAVQRDLSMQSGLIPEQQTRNLRNVNNNSYRRH